MRIKVVYRTQVLCSHHWCKSEKLVISTDRHSAATCIAHISFRGNVGEEKTAAATHTQIWPSSKTKAALLGHLHRAQLTLLLYHCCRSWDPAPWERERVTVRLAFITEVLQRYSCWWLTLENNRPQTANHKSHCKAEFSYLLSHSSAKSVNQGQILARNF